MAKIDVFLKAMVEYGASDLHISVGEPPRMRINGSLQRVQYHDLTSGETEALLLEMLNEETLRLFRAKKDIDFAYQIEGIARFRGNIFTERKGLSGVFRVIPAKIKTLEELGIPESVYALARLKKGMVLVTGATGSGKSTTLAAMIDLINREKDHHIITLEDPIEFIHPRQRCLINQRQLGFHMESFAAGLRAALREDPDVILVGEMRDLDTIQLALTAAETGLLVLGTLHTSSAPKTVDRIIDVFPTTQQAQIRTMLGESLRGVVAQNLLRRADGKGRVAALEVLICNPAVQNLIREGKTFQIVSVMQTGKNIGMQTMSEHVGKLLKDGVITQEEAGIYLGKME